MSDDPTWTSPLVTHWLVMSEERDLQKRMQRIEELVGKIETLSDPLARASARELVQSLMELHGACIERMLEIIAEARAPGIELIDELARDNLVSSLLLLYGLHPLDLNTRVTQALDKVRPYLRSHGGNVELLGVGEGVVRLRLEGSCEVCAASAQTLKLAIEDAIYEAAPDVIAFEVEGVRQGSGSSRLIKLQRKEAPANGEAWAEVTGFKS